MQNSFSSTNLDKYYDVIFHKTVCLNKFFKKKVNLILLFTLKPDKGEKK